MSKIYFAVLALLLLPTVGWAQDHASWEIFGGYQFTRADFGVIQDAVRALNAPYGRPDVTVDHTLNLTGLTLSLQKNFSGKWSGIFDFGVANGQIDVDLSQVMQSLGYIAHGVTYISTMQPTLYTISVGPQFNLKKFGKTQTFLHVMGGGAHSNLKVDSTTQNALTFLAPTYSTTVKSAVAIMGGGLQHPLVKQFALRATADYMVSFLDSGHQNYIRVSAGVVFLRPDRLW